MRIWKYPLSRIAMTTAEMPVHSQVLIAQIQGDQLVIWALVDPKQPLEKRYFFATFTGEEIKGAILGYYGTAQDLDGLAYHIVEIQI